MKERKRQSTYKPRCLIFSTHCIRRKKWIRINIKKDHHILCHFLRPNYLISFSKTIFISPWKLNIYWLDKEVPCSFDYFKPQWNYGFFFRTHRIFYNFCLHGKSVFFLGILIKDWVKFFLTSRFLRFAKTERSFRNPFDVDSLFLQELFELHWLTR